jgi:formylglycine-generating enzyme required for sulfatase activity
MDMIGNAWEWVEDCHEPTYESLPTHGEPRTAASCAAHDVRGGSWDDDPPELRSATRHHVAPSLRRDDLGFRLARDLDR